MTRAPAKTLPYPTAAARRARRPWPSTVPAQTHLQEVLHERDYDVRQHIVASLAESYYKAHRNRATKLALCCTSARFFVAPTVAEVRTWINRCRDRLCPFCSRARTVAAAAKMHKLLRTMAHPRQIILTIRSTDGDLHGQLSFLRKSFARLRRSAIWKRIVKGGCYTVEVTCNEQTSQWHPHLHVLYDGDFFPHQQLRALWNRITETAEVVWISEVHDLEGMAKELTKYIGKPANVKHWSPIQIREYATATQGARLMHNFGSCHGKTLDDRDDNPPPDPDEFSVSLARIVFLACHGNPTASRLAAAICDRWPRFAPYILHTMPQLDPAKTQAEKTLALLNTLRRHDPAAARPPPQVHAGNSVEGSLLAMFRRFSCEADDGTHQSVDLAVQHGYSTGA